jgi:hypothetical protein
VRAAARHARGTRSAEPAGGFGVPTPVAAADGPRLVRIADCCVAQYGGDECSGRVRDFDQRACAPFVASCAKFLACTTGEQTPPCPPGHVRYKGSCARLCNPDRPACLDGECRELMGRHRHACL